MLKSLRNIFYLCLMLPVMAVWAESSTPPTSSLNQLSPDSNVAVDFWLDKMAHAMQQQNFQGTLVIRQKDKLRAVKVKQGADADGTWQTLESLTGENQKIIRQNNQVTTIFPGKKLITVSGALDNGPMHPSLPKNRDEVKKYYSLQVKGEDRVANKTAQIIKMLPKDQYRYGYTFWLDKDSGLLLKCDLSDENGNVLEQLMYSDVELLAEVPAKLGDEAEFRQYKKLNLSHSTGEQSNQWHVVNKPQGFSLRRSVKMSFNDQADAYHMLLADGMSSISVFIEKKDQNHDSMQGLSTMGAVNAYSVIDNNMYITAIGEVPASTVEMIAQSITRNQ